MKKTILYIPILFIVLLFPSCLKSGLNDLPAYSDANITQFNFEYRWFDDAMGQLMVVQIQTAVTIASGTNDVNCTLTVPAASGTFTTSIRDQVALSNLVGYADISTAATMKPIGNTPKLGVPGDFSKTDMKYEVTAADGITVKTWNLKIIAFNK